MSCGQKISTFILSGLWYLFFLLFVVDVEKSADHKRADGEEGKEEAAFQFWGGLWWLQDAIQ